MYKYILSILILFVCIVSYSQKIPFDNYSIKDGLPSNVINDIVQDSKGYLWFATQVGISRFDGYNFKNFSIEDGLPSNAVNCLFRDSKGNIWLGTEDAGAAKYNGKEFHIYNTENGLTSNNRIEKIFEDTEGSIWIITKNDGISKVMKDTIKNYTEENGLKSNRIASSYVDNYGDVWLGTARGLTVISKDTLINYTKETD